MSALGYPWSLEKFNESNCKTLILRRFESCKIECAFEKKIFLHLFIPLQLIPLELDSIVEDNKTTPKSL